MTRNIELTPLRFGEIEFVSKVTSYLKGISNSDVLPTFGINGMKLVVSIYNKPMLGKIGLRETSEDRAEAHNTTLHCLSGHSGVEIITWMYPEDGKIKGAKEQSSIFQCPKCGHKSAVLVDAHDDYICDCNYEMTLGVHNRPLEETDFDKLLEDVNFDEEEFEEEVERIAGFLEKTTSPAYGQGKFWARHHAWKRASED